MRYHDYVTPQERLRHTERRNYKPVILPLIFFALLFWFVIKPAFGGTVVWGRMANGTAYVCERDRGPLIEFCVHFMGKR